MLTNAEIMADVEATASAVEQGFIMLRPRSNTKLIEAINLCITIENRIPDIVATVPEADDPENEILVDALQWKRETIEKQMRRAVRAGKERKAHLESLRTDADWEAELERCGKGLKAEDIEGQLAALKHWFRYWAWAKDPRADFLAAQPFIPFGLYEDDESDFQWRYLEWLHRSTFERRTSGLVEKARDMGATLGWILWSTWCWLFKPEYTALLTSAKEELVDSKKNPDTLFEKVRYEVRMQPPQLLPEGFNVERDMRSHMNIANIESGAVLTGQAPTEDVGRQGRRKAVLKDESAAWPFGGYPQATSLSNVSEAIFDVSSVRGRYNQYAVTAHEPSCNKFVMDWREHPWKDIRWYNSLPYGYLTPIMSPETIAQEVDRDYDASQPGKVFKDWEQTRTCIEWPELLEFYAQYGLHVRFMNIDGSLQIPHDWNWARMQDKGETKGHPRMTLYCAVPGESWPLSDSVFFFIEHMAPTAADLGTVVTELGEEQRQLNLNPPRRPQYSLISHEAKKDRNTYMEAFGWEWDSWDTDYDSGISNIRLWLKVIDTHKPNPIRPMLNGRTKMYLVCAPGQATLLFNPKDGEHGKYFVSPARDSKGFKRLRDEMPVYHYPPEEAGKPVQDQRPVREFDDAIVCVRSIAVLWGPNPKPKSEHEKLMERLAPEIRPGAASKYLPHTPEHDQVILSQQIWMQEFRQEQNPHRREQGDPVRGFERRPPSRNPRTR